MVTVPLNREIVRRENFMEKKKRLETRVEREAAATRVLKASNVL